MVVMMVDDDGQDDDDNDAPREAKGVFVVRPFGRLWIPTLCRIGVTKDQAQ